MSCDPFGGLETGVKVSMTTRPPATIGDGAETVIFWDQECQRLRAEGATIGPNCAPSEYRPGVDQRPQHLDCAGWWPERYKPGTTGVFCECPCHEERGERRGLPGPGR